MNSIASPSIPTLYLQTGIENLAEGANKRHIEFDILPYYLKQKRWFASKDKTITAVRLLRADKLSTSLGEVLLCEIDVDFLTTHEVYQLPLGISWDDKNSSALADLVTMAKVEQGSRAGHVIDAVLIDAFPVAVVQALQIGLGVGDLIFTKTPQFDDAEMPANPKIRRIAAEQSNSSIIVADKIILKLIRRVMSGTNPEIEMLRYLTAQGYANTPPLLGEVSREVDGDQQSIIVAQAFVPNRGDAWEFTLLYLQAPNVDCSAYMSFASAIGTRLAELHAVLARSTDDLAFTPALANQADVSAWVTGAREQILLAFSKMESLETSADGVVEDIEFLTAEKENILASLAELGKTGIGSLRARVHGDFHLGQILVVEQDAYIIDFEGEPAKPVSVRREKSSPLRDVAGLLRSFHYAAVVAGIGPPDFVHLASEAFLDAYRKVERAAQPRWVTDESGGLSLLDLFLLEKSAYEICYELANRPQWLVIPLRGFAEIARRVLKQRPEISDA